MHIDCHTKCAIIIRQRHMHAGEWAMIHGLLTIEWISMYLATANLFKYICS